MNSACVATLVAALICAACAVPPRAARSATDEAAEAYVRLVLALAERDGDSLDTYRGPAEWRADARRKQTRLDRVRADADALASRLAADLAVPSSTAAAADDDRVRRGFLVRQLRAVSERVAILGGQRPGFADEVRLLFGLDINHAPPVTSAAAERARSELDRMLPGSAPLAQRYAAFDRRFLIPADRVAVVLSRAVEGCRTATKQHLELPSRERVEIDYVADLPWSAFTRYDGDFVSRIRVNTSLPLTVDRALDLACHEAYPGHHTIQALLEARFGSARPELLVQPLFSPQSLIHEAAASLAPDLAFTNEGRLVFERDVLFPLVGLDPSDADRYVRISRLVDALHGDEARIVREYLDGTLDFPRAAAALEREALMPSADATLKFVNQFRSYAATYTTGRDALVDRIGLDWPAYMRVVTDPAQEMPAHATH